MNSILTDDEKKAAREKKAAEWAALDDLRVAADRRSYETFEERMAEERARVVSTTRSNEAHVAACEASGHRHAEVIAAIKEQTAVFERIAKALEGANPQPRGTP